MKDILVLLVCAFFYCVAVKKLVADFNDIYGDAIDDFFDGYADPNKISEYSENKKAKTRTPLNF